MSNDPEKCPHNGADWCARCRPARQVYGPEQAVGCDVPHLGYRDPPLPTPPPGYDALTWALTWGCATVPQSSGDSGELVARLGRERFDAYAEAESLRAQLATVTRDRDAGRAALWKLIAQGELVAKAQDSLAMATPDRVLRSVAKDAAKKFRAALASAADALRGASHE